MQGGSKTHTVLFVAFMCFVVVWRVWETFRKHGTERGRTSMVWSFYVLFVMSVVIFGGTIAEFFLVKRVYHIGWAVLGFSLFAVANVIRISAIGSLGRYWSLHVEVRERHPFVREGMYRYVRHPAYLSFVLEHVAVPLVGNAWWTLAVTVFVYVPLIVLRLSREEAALVDKFGDVYRAYQQEVGALVPKLSAFRRAADA